MRLSFEEHPRSVGQTYAAHMATAARSGVELLGAGAACLVHAAFPFLFVNAASDALARVQHRLASRHGRPVDGTGRAHRAEPPG